MDLAEFNLFVIEDSQAHGASTKVNLSAQLGILVAGVFAKIKNGLW